ncbi:class I adenylate-forming enzyme family protein [Streptomyces sp. HUAS TT20]|uniref:class I adenylate-forming enzyme family protein n=1 Tax=Streptomyces sp. HUAS TT20 TaxID=3447509 RepID=UPI0021DAD97F|nr:class I adenylate-forming enzyme family protein [Streptomyces sp. HUAS 15-9]UXY33088.1 acyl--CoA ligase [Streptomyces sp. HUAS 15-9]
MRILRQLDSPLDVVLRRAATRAGDRPAVTNVGDTALGDTAVGDTTTFEALDREADRVAHWIDGALRRADSAVVVACALDAAFPALYFGAVRSGRLLALLDPAAGSAAAHELCTAAWAEVAFVPGHLAALLTAEAEEGRLPRLHTIVVTDGGRDGDNDGDNDGVAVPLADALSAVPGTPFRTPVGDLDAVACVQLVPHPVAGLREVRLSHRNLLANAAQIAVAHQLDPASVVVNQMPAYHPALLGAAVHAGAEQVLVSDPDPCAGMTVSRGRQATHYYGLSTRLARLAEDERLADHRTVLPGGHLRAVLSAGVALEPVVARRLGDTLRVPVLQGYGVGGLSALSHVQAPGARPERGAVGVPLPGTECRVVDPVTRAPAPVWSDGEVEIRGPQVPAGRADGWLATGDVGYLDLDDQLHLVRRSGSPFACGDAVVAPGVVERVLRQDPRVADCAVADVPDPVTGSSVWAGVVLREGVGEGDGEEVRDAPDILDAVAERANAQLGPGEQIRRLEAVETLPRRIGAKPVPRMLVRQYLTAA